LSAICELNFPAYYYAAPEIALFVGDAMKTLATWISFAVVFAVTPLIARPTLAQTTDFKVGASVEVMVGGKWETGLVTGRSGCGGSCGGYYVSQGRFGMVANDSPASIRAHVMTPAEQAEANTIPSAEANTIPSTDAPAAKPAGGNPILGRWTLVDTNMATVCRAERVFQTYQAATSRHEVPAIYVVQPTYVEVSYGGPNTEEWELHGPNDITLRMTSPYSVGYGNVGAQAQANCRYHRK
jgi:hypothetical protein